MSIEVDIKKNLGSFKLQTKLHSEGGIIGLLGASGCGKSLTLQCISGIMKPDEGRIVLNGRTLFDSEKKINLAPQERNVGYLFQNYALFPNMTVEQNIACGLRGKKGKKKRFGWSAEEKNAISDMINRMSLSGLEKQYPIQLSGGQQQRTALARILIGKPEIMLMDEPMSALDTYLKEKLRNDLLILMKEFNKDTIIVTHDRIEAYEMCDNISVMDKGRILAAGGTKELFRSPGCSVAATLTGCKNIIPAKKAGAHEITVPSWGVTFDTKDEIKDSLTGIAIREYHFSDSISQNSYPVNVVDIIEQPLEWVVKFRYENQDPMAEPVWRRIRKTDASAVDIKNKKTECLGILPVDILPLYDE